MAKPSAATTAWASLRADVDILRIKLQQLRKESQRVVDELDEVLAGPPFSDKKKESSFTG
jgi:hypothetical protein